MIVNQETPLVLYGAATMGGIVYSKLIENNFHVLGFFDKRADEIHEYMGVPVFEYQKTESIDRDHIVILITVKNVFEHSTIAKELLQYGYSNIIFFPIENLEGRGEIIHQEMEAVYQHYTRKDFSGSEDRILQPITEDFFREPIKKITILEEREHSVVVPLFVSELMIDRSMDDLKVREMNVLLLQPHIRLFQLLLGESEGEMESYMKYCMEAAQENSSIKRTQRWKENVISNRRDIFYRLEYGSMLDNKFLIHKAPKVKWNTKGYFNLLSGKHRCAYFISKKQFYIPVEMSRDDFLLWKKESERRYREILLLARNSKKLIFENPFLYQKMDAEKSFQHLLLFNIASQIHEFWNMKGVLNNVNHKKILLVGENRNLIIEDFFSFMGAVVDSYNLNFRELNTRKSLSVTDHFYDLGISFTKDSQKYCKKNIFILSKEEMNMTEIFHTIYKNKKIWVYKGENEDE